MPKSGLEGLYPLSMVNPIVSIAIQILHQV